MIEVGSDWVDKSLGDEYAIHICAEWGGWYLAICDDHSKDCLDEDCIREHFNEVIVKDNK